MLKGAVASPLILIEKHALELVKCRGVIFEHCELKGVQQMLIEPGKNRALIAITVRQVYARHDAIGLQGLGEYVSEKSINKRRLPGAFGTDKQYELVSLRGFYSFHQ